MLSHHKIGDLEVHIIEGDKDAPFILLLHGYGADGLDMAGLYQDLALPLKPTWIFPTAPLRIPLGYHSYGNAWYPLNFSLLEPGHKVDLNQVFPKELSHPRTVIEEVIASLKIPLPKLIIGGFSQGAILSLDFALHQLNPLAGVVILSGALVFEKEWEKLAPLHKTIPFFQSHGKSDPLLPYEEAASLHKLLTHCGLTGKFVSFNGGHGIPPLVQSELKKFFEENLS